MRATLLAIMLALTAGTSTAAPNDLAVGAACLMQQRACNKACPRGQPTTMSCINLCTSQAQLCVANGGVSGSSGGSSSSADDDDDDRDSRKRTRSSTSRSSRSSSSDDDDSSSDRDSGRKSSRNSSSSSSSGSNRTGRCTADAEFVHSWPVDKANDEFKFKFKVSSDDCKEYSCRGYVHYRIHYNWRSGGNNTKTTLVRFTIPDRQRSTEVTDKTFPGPVGIPLDVRDVEIKEVSCSSP